MITNNIIEKNSYILKLSVRSKFILQRFEKENIYIFYEIVQSFSCKARITRRCGLNRSAKRFIGTK